MTDYVIFADASCDINLNYAKKEGIELIPMSYILDGEEYMATGWETPEEIADFYSKLREGASVSTSQVTPQVYIDKFTPYLEQGKDILYLCLSSGLTGTYSNVSMICEDLQEDYPDRQICACDTIAATGATGMLVEKAVENKKNGMSAKENCQYIIDNRDNLFTIFLVEDLEHLRRGGRISEVTAMIGTALKICPILNFDKEGKLIVIAKKRKEMAIKHLASEFLANCGPESKRGYVIHAGAPDRAEKLCNLIHQERPDVELEVRTLAPVIGAHTGPDMTACTCWK